jgi:hypothetical protein
MQRLLDTYMQTGMPWVTNCVPFYAIQNPAGQAWEQLLKVFVSRINVPLTIILYRSQLVRFTSEW